MVSDNSPKDENTTAGKDDKMRSVDGLLLEDADGLLEELDDPEELRRWFNRIVERLEQEGLDGPLPDKETEKGTGPT